MKNAVIYFGSLESDFARKQDWSVLPQAMFRNSARAN